MPASNDFNGSAGNVDRSRSRPRDEPSRPLQREQSLLAPDEIAQFVDDHSAVDKQQAQSFLQIAMEIDRNIALWPITGQISHQLAMGDYALLGLIDANIGCIE